MQPAEHAAEKAAEGFNAGEVIIGHIANSPIDHPLIHLPKVFGIDFSVTKHVLMLWICAAAVFLIVTWTVRRYLRQERMQPTGFMTALEILVEFIRDTIVLPNVGSKWVLVYTPILLTLFLFILTRERHRSHSDLRPGRAHQPLLPASAGGVVLRARAARRRHRHRQLQRDGGAGDDHVLPDHHRRRARARLRAALEEHDSARACRGRSTSC